MIAPYGTFPRTHESSDDLGEHKRTLNSILASWNFVLEPVFGDGNCFFVSVALNLVNDPEANKNIMEEVGIDLDQPITALVCKLRKILVNEWLGPKRREYDVVCDSEEYEAEAVKFLHDGYYDSVIGDTMPLAMANALKCNIVLFRSSPGMPISYIVPRQSANNVIFIAYTDYGPGHYDSVLYKGEADLHQFSASVIKCRCGVNVKVGDSLVCVDTPERHSYCKCLAAKRSCSNMCGCKGCSNPYGHRVTLGKRKRVPHTWQKFDLSSTSVTLRKGQTLADGGWSLFETIVFTHVIHFLECNSVDPITPESIHSAYNCIVEYAQAPHCSIPHPCNAVFRRKTTKQVESKFDHFSVQQHLFEQSQ